MRSVRDGRQDAGAWSSFADPLTIVFFRGLSLAFAVLLLVKGFAGVGRAFLIGLVVVVFASLAVRDIRRTNRRVADV
jgi:hypothetical protein